MRDINAVVFIVVHQPSRGSYHDLAALGQTLSLLFHIGAAVHTGHLHLCLLYTSPLEQLDVEQTLARLTAREEQGGTFVNIERTDQKTRRIRGACIGAALFVTMMAFVMAIMGWAIYTDPQDAPPLPLLVVMFGIPAGCIVGTPVSYTHLDVYKRQP